jgi:SRSO17 transposase
MRVWSPGFDPGIAYRLYLPEIWANDAERREKAHVPEDVEFQTKPQIALAQIEAALKAGVARGVVLTDVAYGSDGAFRAGVTALGLIYAAGVQSTLSVWPPGEEPLPPKPWSGRGRKPSRLRHDADHRPISAKELAMRLPAEAWNEVEWREGSNQPLSSRFAALRVRPASRDHKLVTPHPVEWLVVEWPEDEAEPTKYWLSTLPEDVPLAALVDVIKLRWRIERDYEELKSELGLAHFEGRGWRGFHHHASLCIAAYGFLILERSVLPAQRAGAAKDLPFPAVLDPQTPPIRPERHVPDSIATIRKRLTIALAKSLHRCPCCQAVSTRRAFNLRL